MTTELTAVARGSACELAVTSVRSTISSGAFAGTWISATIAVAVRPGIAPVSTRRSEEHTSELQSRLHLVCRLLLEKKKKDREQDIPRAEHRFSHRPRKKALPA